MTGVIQLSERRQKKPDRPARVFIPCPSCGTAIELKRDTPSPTTIECPTCGAKLVR